MPSAEYDQKDVSCFSQASSMAPQVGPTNENATYALDVTCEYYLNIIKTILYSNLKHRRY